MDSKQLEDILTYLCEELGGDWLLTGGALVRHEFDAQRGTEDVDLVRFASREMSDEAAKTLLFKWLIARGLGPEWVNSAVEPFVKEVPNWSRETVLIRAGSKGNILRPNLSLFTYLKFRRGTEIDILDVQKALPKCPEGFDEPKFLSWADAKTSARFRAFRKKLGI
jgi:hypothetical protein